MESGPDGSKEHSTQTQLFMFSLRLGDLQKAYVVTLIKCNTKYKAFRFFMSWLIPIFGTEVSVGNQKKKPVVKPDQGCYRGTAKSVKAEY